MARPDHDLAGLAAAHARLLRSIETLTDADVRRPSLLPGWSIAHVLTHLARNADSMVRMTEAAGRGEVVWQYAEGQREREIEEGAGRSAGELVDDVRRTAAALESTWASTSDDTWTNGAARAKAGERAVAHLPFLRWREVEFHHADLGLPGYTYADLDTAYVAREESDVVPPRFGGRTRDG